MIESDINLADKLARRRARLCMVFGALLLLTMLGSINSGPHLNRPDTVKFAGWIIALVLSLTIGGGALRGKSVRSLLRDEGTQANSQAALTTAYWLAIATAIALFAASYFSEISGSLCARMIISIALASASIRFGILEMRSLKSA